MERRAEAIQSLRDLATHLETHPGLDLPDFSRMFVFCSDKEGFARNVRALGKGEKSSTKNYINVTRDFGTITVEVTAPHRAVCEKVSLGTRRVVKSVPTFHDEEVEEEVFEWVCPESVLSGSPVGG